MWGGVGVTGVDFRRGGGGPRIDFWWVQGGGGIGVDFWGLGAFPGGVK